MSPPAYLVFTPVVITTFGWLGKMEEEEGGGEVRGYMEGKGQRKCVGLLCERLHILPTDSTSRTTSLDLIITSSKLIFWRTLFPLLSLLAKNVKITHIIEPSIWKSSSDDMMWMVSTRLGNLIPIWIQIYSKIQQFPHDLYTPLWKHPPNYRIQEPYFYNLSLFGNFKIHSKS